MKTGKVKIAQLDANTNEIINVFNSYKQAEESIGVKEANIYRCVKGKYKTSGGFKWEYILNDNIKE